MQQQPRQSGSTATTDTGLPAFAPVWAIFLDIDGTLLEHVDRPDAIRPDAALGKLLAELDEVTGSALALISGRPVAELDALFAPLQLAVAGQHGIERRDARRTMHRHPFPLEPLRRAVRQLGEFAAGHAGLLLEDKGHSLALHYRLAPELAGTAREAVNKALAGLGSEFEMQSGKLVFEIKPGGRDKGTAIEEFTGEPPFAGRVPVFIGDDASDEYGFAIVNRAGGHSIKVGPGASIASGRLADAGAVRKWLGAYADYLETRVGAP
jgi:trehalose 6-phosphate phosphatase